MSKFTKYLALMLLSLLGWVSCKDTPSPEKMEAPAANQPIAPDGMNLDAAQQKELAAKSGVRISESEIVGVSEGTITGSNVSIRQSGTIKSEKVGVFDNNEAVKILSSMNVKNEGEAILSKSITVKGSGGSVTLTKGKAVMIEDYDSATNSYQVSYEDPKKGKLNAKIEASAAETIIFATWFNVERANGEKGWVLGKFLKTK
jgi:hypothetical protein